MSYASILFLQYTSDQQIVLWSAYSIGPEYFKAKLIPYQVDGNHAQ